MSTAKIESPVFQFRSKVKHGDKTGRTIGFPTINLDPMLLPEDFKTGIYASTVSVNLADTEETYPGCLYFGPRLIKGETHNVLEIHLIDVNVNLYDKDIHCCIGQFIREIKNFDSLNSLKKQIALDISDAKKILGL